MTETSGRSVAEEIRHNLDRLTPTERKPAQALLADYPMAGLETVAQFAARSGVSAPTILRLISKLGFQGYGAFQRKLRGEVAARLQSPLTRGHDSVAPKDDILDRFASAACDNIRMAARDISRQDFEAVADLLAAPRRPVHLLGGRFTDAMARYFYLHLRAVRPNVHRIDGQASAWPEYLLDMGKRDVLVVFDIRRYQQDVVEFTEQAAQRGVTVVLFTDQWLSPIFKIARYVFSLHIDVPSNWDSAVATLAVVEALLARLTDDRWSQVSNRMAALEAMQASFEAED